MIRYCRKRKLTHEEARTAVRCLYYRNNGKKKRGRQRDESLSGELHAYYCNTCEAWHVGHWRPREAMGGHHLPYDED